LLEQLEPESRAYHMRAAYRVKGEVVLERLERAVAVVVRRHEPLRANVVAAGGEPFQVIHEARAHPVAVEDLSALCRPLAPAGRDEELQRRMVAEVRRPFDLAEGPLMRLVLYRLAEREHALLVVMHHIVSDGWSMGIFVGELLEAYAALGEGRPTRLADPGLSYTEHARRQQAAIERGAFRNQLGWWKARLDGAPPALDLPTDRPRPASQGYRGGVRTATMPVELTGAIERLARASGATPFMTLLAALAAVLQRYTDSTDLTIGTAIAGRNRADVEALIGFFVNTLPLRIDLSGDPTFGQLLARVRQTAIEAFDHQDLPFERLVEELRPARDPSRPPIVQVMLIVQNAPTPVLEQGGLRLEYLEVEWGSARFDLTLFARPDAGRWRLLADYDADLFDGATIDRLLDHVGRVLDRASTQPDRPVTELDLVTPEETRLLDGWNRTDVEYPRATVPDLFEARAARAPAAPAIEDGPSTLTAGELNRRANRLAHRLRKAGVAERDVVAVLRDRSAASVVALLAVMKAGAAYLPIDPRYPEERVAFLLRHSGARAVVTSAALAPSLPADTPPVTRDDASDLGDEPDTDPPRTTTPEDAAYLLYTSGSTGEPKGVAGPHRGAVNRIAWEWRAYPASADEVCLHRTSIAFVDSVQEVFGPLLAGVPLVIARDEVAADPRALIDLVTTHRVTRLVVVPSLLRALVEIGPDARAVPASLRLVITSGERLPADLAAAFRARWPGATLLNLYGSSEVAGDVTAWDATGDRGPAAPPIGRPIANTRIYVVDRRGRRAPIGVPGEVVVGGAGVARGYVGRSDLTAERFVPDDLGAAPGGVLFRTGDRGRFRPDGTLEYLGRLDRQIKIRGVRIEPAETEAALRDHPAVRDAAVGPWERRPGDAELAAWFVAAGEPAPPAAELRAFLAAKLPAFLVPSRFVPVAAIPRTASGKVDGTRLAVSEPALGHPTPAGGEPRTPAEILLAEIWREEIGCDPVRTGDNFYDLGGHSLLAVRVVEKVRRRAGCRLEPRELLLQTMGQVARRCEELQPALARRAAGAGERVGIGHA
jgi:amino acid adenylation domain-containing protein